MTDSEDREQQAAVSRMMLYYLNTPLAEGYRLRGVLPATGAVRIAVRGGDGESGETFLYEIPHDIVGPAWIPGVLRAVLSGTQLYGSSDVSKAFGMTLIRLHPERVTPAPEPEEGQALGALLGLGLGLGLGGADDDENPFLIGFLLREGGLVRVYVQRPGRSGLIGVDIRLAEATTALTASLPSLLDEEEHQRPAPDDPHCDFVVDLTNW